MLSLSPLQSAIGVATPQVESWKEAEERKQDEARKKAHEAAIISWNAHWKAVGSRKEWDTIVSPKEVYNHCGGILKEDPRLKSDYREQVLTKLGLNQAGLAQADKNLK